MPHGERAQRSLARRTANWPNLREPVIPEQELVTAVAFEVELPAGPAELQTWLAAPGGRTHRASRVTVDRQEHR